MASAKRQKPDRPVAESLEPRLLLSIAGPLSIGGATSGTFQDANGDVVVVTIRGASGQASFVDTAGQPGVADGTNIKTVAIAGAAKDFVISFRDADGNSSGPGDILLGDITSNRPIGGILAVPGSGSNSSAQLGSYTGALGPSAQINVTDILGDGDGVGLRLPSLAADAVVTVTGELAGDVVIASSLSGTISANYWSGGLTVRRSVTPSGAILCSAFDGPVAIGGSFLGRTNIGGSTQGTWQIKGSVGPSAAMMAGGWNDLEVGASVAGHVVANDDNVDLTVGRTVTSSAVIGADENVRVHARSIARGAQVTAYNGQLAVQVSGVVQGNLNADSYLEIAAGGLRGGRYTANTGPVAIQITGSVVMSQLAASDEMMLDVGRDVSGSSLYAGADMTGQVAGRAVNSSFTSGAGMGDSGDPLVIGRGAVKTGLTAATLNVAVPAGGSANSDFLSQHDGQVDVAGKVVNTRFVSGEMLALHIDGDFLSGHATSGNAASDTSLQAAVSGNVGPRVLFQAGGDQALELAVGGSFAGLASSGGNMSVQVNKDLAKQAVVSCDDNLTLKVGNDLFGRANTSMLDLIVAGNVQKTAQIQANEGIDDIDNDNAGFTVGGSFAGTLDVHGDLNTGGAGAVITLIGQKVLPMATIHLDGMLTGADKVVFGGDFLGRLELGSLSGTDLAFAGSARRIHVAGGISANISVGGKLSLLSSASQFEGIGPLGGNFRDDAGAVTGTLVTGAGYDIVLPELVV